MSLPDDARPRLSDIDWRWALPRIVAVFLVTRLLVLVLLVAVETTQTNARPPDHLISDERPILTTLTAWDGIWYRSIAESGYHAEVDDWPDYAFYPGYAIAIKATSVLTAGDTALAALLVSNAAFLLALIVLYALSLRYLSRERAILSLWFLALAPGALAFTLAYTESLFLLLALGAFLAAEMRRPWLAGILLAVATVTRPTGILLGLPLLVLYAGREGLRPTRSWIPLLLAPLALAGWFAYLWWLTGDPMAAVHAQAYWDDPTPVLVEAEPGVTRHELPQQPAIVAYFVVIALYTFSLVYLRADRLPMAYLLVVVMVIVSVFLAGRLDSAVRYLVLAWPTYWAFADRRSRVGRGVLLAVFVGLQVMFTWYIFTWHLLP